MDELVEKTERLVAMMNAKNYGGVLLNSQHNFAWLTGGKSNGIDLSQSNGVGSLLIRNDGKRYLLANNIEATRFLREEISYEDFEQIDFKWQTEKENPRHILKVAGRIVGSKLGTDLMISPHVEVCESLVANCRHQLTTHEVARFQQLGRDSGEIIGKIYEKIEVGQTEKEIANIVKFELGKKNINSIVTLVAADDRIASFRHPIPTENIWKKVLMIVVCAKRDGLIASLSRIFSIGDVSDDLRKRTDAVGLVHAKMMHATRPNAVAKEIFDITKNAYSEVGFEFEEDKHHQGGACGYKTRDWVAHSKSIEQVKLNQAFAWNPSITGTKSEETFIVNDKGISVITTSPNFPTISNVVDGIEYLTPDIFIL